MSTVQVMNAVKTTPDEPEAIAGSNPSMPAVSQDGPLYRVLDGRIFNSKNNLYLLPADDEEHSRLDMQHFAITLIMDSLVPFRDAAKTLLRDGQARPPQVLDIGTGSGRWAVDMATTYPAARVLGIDLVLPVLATKEKLPENCRFEIHDANQPMEQYENMFSVVHSRMMEFGLTDNDSFFYDVARVLRPGGLFILGMADAQIYDEHFEPYTFGDPGIPGFCWTQYMFGLVHRAGWNQGAPATHIKRWFREWLDANPNFSQTQVEEVYVPIGAWGPGLNSQETRAGELMGEALSQVFVVWRQHFLQDGLPSEDVDKWIKASVDEVKNLEAHAYLKMMYIGATRGEGQWKPREGPAPNPADYTSRSSVKGLEFKLSS